MGPGLLVRSQGPVLRWRPGSSRRLGNFSPTLSSSGPNSGLFDLDAVPASNGSGGNGIDELPDLGDIADESHLEGGAVTLDDFLGAFSNSL
jgi:hypothetical protein